MRRRALLGWLLAACGSDGGGGQTGEACGPIDLMAPQPNTLAKVISQPSTLKKSCSPYFIAEPVSVQTELTIEPGVTLIACKGGCRSRLVITPAGKLSAVGTAEEPIVFTSIYRESPQGPARGQWTGILFIESRPGSRLEHVVIEHAGGPYELVDTGDEFGTYEFPRHGSIMVDSAEGIEISNVRIDHSRAYAVAVTTSDDFTAAGRDVFAAFDSVTLVDVEQGMWLPVDQGGTLGPDVCFAERDAAGLCPGDRAPVGVFVEAHLDDVVGRAPENVRRDATWRSYGAPWHAESVNIENGALLTIEDGVELRLTNLGGIFVGISGPGALDMRGSAPGGIRVRAVDDSPPPGQHWDGIYLWTQVDGARTAIENVDLGYGGKRSPRIDQSAPAILGIYNTGESGAQPRISGVHVHDSLGAGIHWNCLAAPSGLEPANEGNTSSDASIACAGAIGGGIAENYGCACPGACGLDRCPQPDP
jgi:hypothetical protein